MLWFSSRGILASTYDNKKREKKGPDMGRLVTSGVVAAAVSSSTVLGVDKLRLIKSLFDWCSRTTMNYNMNVINNKILSLY